MTQTRDTETEHVRQQLSKLFDRDDVWGYDDNEVPYDFTVERTPLHSRSEFHLDYDEVEQLRVLPVRIHSVLGDTLRLEWDTDTVSDGGRED